MILWIINTINIDIKEEDYSVGLSSLATLHYVIFNKLLEMFFWTSEKKLFQF
jgi:hypothetical protein